MTAVSPSGKPTLEQRRARHAWEAVQRAQKLDAEDQKDYGREAKKLPMRIHAAGLGHALAFLHAKAKINVDDKKQDDGRKKDGNNHDEVKKGLTQLIADVTDWSIKKRPLPASEDGDLMQSIVKGDAVFLRRATEETLAYLLWLVRFAEASGLTKDAEDMS